MKFALIIPDGMADEPQPSLENRTPLQAAAVPHMDEVASLGIVGQTNNVPEAMPSGSDVGTMSLFGYDPLKFHTGRAPLEAAALGIELGPDDWAIRCNLVTIESGRMRSFTAEQIPSELGAHLIELMQHACCGDPHWRFFAGVSYRNLLIYRVRDGQAPFGADTFSVPPHDVTGQLIEEFLPMGSGSCDLRALMEKSVELFANDERNQQRVDECGHSATQIWLWGEGQRPALENFADRFGVQAAVITAVDLLRGIGRLIGWEIVNVPGATGYLDTDYAAKGRAAIETLQSKDLVVVHVEATDEASHEGDVAAKIAAVERIDREIVGPVHHWLRSQGDYRLLVCPDHPTFLRTKTHSHGYVPFAMCGAGIDPDPSRSYDEVVASRTGDVVDAGHELMSRFLQG
jgi:2,3-bisphosphoglycerate-independent phosphoglycerate mutase